MIWELRSPDKTIWSLLAKFTYSEAHTWLFQRLEGKADLEEVRKPTKLFSQSLTYSFKDILEIKTKHLQITLSLC